MKRINNKAALSALALAIVVAGCSEKEVVPGVEVPDMSGVPVNFSLKTTEGQSRTFYNEDSWNDDATSAEIYWGNPWGVANQTEQKEQVVVYGMYTGRNKALYTLSGYTEPTNGSAATGSATATTLDLASTVGVQWGSQPAATTDKVTFFSVYPAYAGEYMSDDAQTAGVPDPSTGKLRTAIPGQQSPRAYRVKSGSSSTSTLPTAKGSGKTVIYCEPDMRGGVMVAKTEVEYGAEQVALQYSMIANVLDITINGPEYNTGAGAGNNDGEEIRTVIITNVKNEAIAGVFDYDVNNSTVTGNPNANSQIPLGQTNSSGTVVYPKLWAHDAANSDQIRLRVFLLPGVNPSDLSFQLQTPNGYYQIGAGRLTQSFQEGKIHKLILPKLNPAKDLQNFEFDHWIDQLNPNIYLTEMSIPGSWESFNVGTGNSNFQSSDYLDQYAKGVRAFSVRPQRSNGAVYAYGGPTLETVIQNLGNKIKGTKEFIVLIIRGVDKSYNGGSSSSTDNDMASDIRTILLAQDAVYKEAITPNTTINDVIGKIIVKCNVDNSANVLDSSNQLPGLFSKWATGSQGTVLYAPLDYGYWTSGRDASTTPVYGNTGLTWCFSENDNISINNNTGNYTSLTMLKQAFDTYYSTSYDLWKGREHNAWFFITIGGYGAGVFGYVATPSSEVASTMNQYALNKLTNPTREASPTGIIMMNFATESLGQQLITAIINNNRAYKPAVATGGSSGNSSAQHDSSYSPGGNLAQ